MSANPVVPILLLWDEQGNFHRRVGHDDILKVVFLAHALRQNSVQGADHQGEEIAGGVHDVVLVHEVEGRAN